MLEQIIITEELHNALIEASNSSNEYSGYLLGELTPEGVKLVNAAIGETAANSASVNYIPKKYWDKVHAEPDKYALLSVHSHSVKFCDKIRWCDPFWSIKKEPKSPEEKRQFIQVSGAETDDGDVVEALRQKAGLEYALFVHPCFGSAGETMTKEKVQITAYKYDSSSVGKVKEIPLKIDE
ncbi:hypothetical protein GF343_05210 [Candidatus Woesearchaeota archaeon]|nr:hypothetical protein [Candidatus Woesearchaeota archaeon]